MRFRNETIYTYNRISYLFVYFIYVGVNLALEQYLLHFSSSLYQPQTTLHTGDRSVAACFRQTVFVGFLRLEP